MKEAKNNQKKSYQTFCRTPKMLFETEKYKGISAQGKLLYSLMLDRASLSEANGWRDEAGRVYIIFTLKAIREAVNCCHSTAVKLLKELDEKTGAGLIRCKNQGNGKPNYIYVQTPEMLLADCSIQETDTSPSEKHTRTDAESIYEPVCKTDTNNTKINNIKNNNIEFNHITRARARKDASERIEEINDYREFIKCNIDYNSIRSNYPPSWLDGVVEIMTDIVTSRDPYIRIDRREYPQKLVKDRFLELNCVHIDYVHMALSEVTYPIRNIRSYLITSLFHAPETIDMWFAAKVKRDMARY